MAFGDSFLFNNNFYLEGLIRDEENNPYPLYLMLDMGANICSLPSAYIDIKGLLLPDRPTKVSIFGEEEITAYEYDNIDFVFPIWTNNKLHYFNFADPIIENPEKENLKKDPDIFGTLGLNALRLAKVSSIAIDWDTETIKLIV